MRQGELTSVYRAEYSRPVHDDRLEACTLVHRGALPPGWLAPGFVVNLVLGGEADIRARGASHRVGVGDVVLADAGEFRRVTRRHSVQAVTRSLTLHPTFLLNACAERGARPSSLHFVHSTSGDSRLIMALRMLYGSIDAEEARLTIESMVEGLLDALPAVLRLRAGTPCSNTRTPVRRARDMIEDDPAQVFSLQELAAEANLSRAHFIRAFRAAFGTTPHQYVIQARIRRARALLESGAALADAALAVGFYDQSHFTKHFTRLMGIRPSQFRRAVCRRRTA